MTHLHWSRSHGDSWEDTRTLTVPRQADPPSEGGTDTSADDAAIGGGADGFPLPESQQWSAWDVVAGQSPMLTDLREFCELLNDSPDLRATAVLRSLERVRRELERCPDDSQLTSPIQLTLQDTVVLAQALLQRLR